MVRGKMSPEIRIIRKETRNTEATIKWRNPDRIVEVLDFVERTLGALGKKKRGVPHSL